MDPPLTEAGTTHGADPNCASPAAWRERGVPYAGPALDDLLITYSRAPEKLSACVDILLAAHAKSTHETLSVFAVLRGHVDELRVGVGSFRVMVSGGSIGYRKWFCELGRSG